MAQTYRTRVLTARDRLLVDKLRGDPRYRAIADRLDPPLPTTKPEPRGRPDEDDRQAERDPPPVTKPKPKA